MIIVAKCFNRKCIHFRGVKQPNKDEMNEYNYCSAFPQGIPSKIAYGDDLHLVVHKDQQNDIVYTKKEKGNNYEQLFNL